MSYCRYIQADKGTGSLQLLFVENSNKYGQFGFVRWCGILLVRKTVLVGGNKLLLASVSQPLLLLLVDTVELGHGLVG